MSIKINLNITQMHAMSVALSALDGFNQPATNGGTTYVLYSLGVTRLALAKIGNLLAPHIATYEKARLALVKECRQIDGMSEAEWTNIQLVEGHPNWCKWCDAYTKILEHEEEIEFPEIKTADLRLDKNEIPIGALAALSTIIVE